ncbi:MAG: penicillin-binding transpeptidase domain-containing protein [Bacillota bacterium]|jgi:stage V sporulation protein D (sporulation-specific penicillin-binding protein)|nr:penicillin-binding transpeptidase domain-containing protein [Bacillota bacterium]HHU43163.1 PASTA domain-containing protein [Clostridiales bacterium]
MTLIAFLFAAVMGKLIYIQIINSKNLQIKALDQWTRDIPVVGERGDIFDRNGELLADTFTTYTVYVRPVAVKDKYHTSLALSEVLSLNREKLFIKMLSKVSEITVKKKVTKKEMSDIINYGGVSGVYFSPNISRYYPYGNFMTQILGFTNIDGVGQSGVEAYYNKYLQGKNGYILTETDLVGRELDDSITRYIPGKKGDNIYLTIDYYIQQFAENAVENAFVKYNAKSTSCIVMNAKTGEILAMAQRPSYDLNNVPRDNVVELFENSKSILVSNVYESGSTFKILTTAMALDYEVMTREHSLHCPGYRIVDGQRIRCWKTIGHGSLSFDEGVQNSCNCLFMDMAQKIGAKNFYKGIEYFGLTKKTGIDMSGETSGLVIPYKDVKTVDLARMGFGQAIAVSPIELVVASASVLNGGRLMKPYVLDRVERDNKTIFQNYPIERNKTISKNTSKEMREVLELVVTDGSGRQAGVNGYRIGGKTGTAQKYENGVIAHGKYLSTFLGYAPAEDPEYIILMMVDEPQGGLYYGSIVAAPYVGEIFKNIFEYKDIPPSTLKPKEHFAMPLLEGLTVAQAKNKLYNLGLYYEIVGEGEKVVKQIPIENSFVTTDNIVLIELG